MVDNKQVTVKHSMILSSQRDAHIQNTTNTVCELMYMQGNPIREAKVSHGPFVMGSKQELEDTFRR